MDSFQAKTGQGHYFDFTTCISIDDVATNSANCILDITKKNYKPLDKSHLVLLSFLGDRNTNYNAVQIPFIALFN